jgi:hypothetical protein
MINTVRTLVQAFANKQNYGYLPPSDFDLFAEKAQLSEFEDLVFRYTQWKTMQMQGRAGSGLADIPENIEQDIEVFMTGPEVLSGENEWDAPEDMYYIDPEYGILVNGKNATKIPLNKVAIMQSSDMMAPSSEFPMWTLSAKKIQVYPTADTTQVSAIYVRYPVSPQWAYDSLAGGEPIYNQTNSIDFELPLSYLPSLVIKIASYLGISIREQDLTEYMKREEVQEQQVKG